MQILLLLLLLSVFAMLTVSIMLYQRVRRALRPASPPPDGQSGSISTDPTGPEATR